VLDECRVLIFGAKREDTSVKSRKSHRLYPPPVLEQPTTKQLLVTMTLLKGIVTKAGVMEKTITVTVERKVIHPTLLKVCLHCRVVFTRPRAH
jgi:hypothetical protein